MFCVRLLYNHKVVSFKLFNTYESALDYANYLGSLSGGFSICISRA